MFAYWVHVASTASERKRKRFDGDDNVSSPVAIERKRRRQRMDTGKTKERHERSDDEMGEETKEEDDDDDDMSIYLAVEAELVSDDQLST